MRSHARTNILSPARSSGDERDENNWRVPTVNMCGVLIRGGPMKCTPISE